MLFYDIRCQKHPWGNTIHMIKDIVHGQRMVLDKISITLYLGSFSAISMIISSTGFHAGTDIKFKMNARPHDHFHNFHIWQNIHYTCIFYIEFQKIPRNFTYFSHILQNALKINPNYPRKRNSTRG